MTASYGPAGEMLGLTTTRGHIANADLQPDAATDREQAPGLDMQYMYTADRITGGS